MKSKSVCDVYFITNDLNQSYSRVDGPPTNQ